jgi:hypothetical protein
LFVDRGDSVVYFLYFLRVDVDTDDGWPSFAKQAPVTRPTYPVPMMEMFIVPRGRKLLVLLKLGVQHVSDGFSDCFI